MPDVPPMLDSALVTRVRKAMPAKTHADPRALTPFDAYHAGYGDALDALKRESADVAQVRAAVATLNGRR